MSLNKVTLSGNLGAAAVLRATRSGTQVLTFSVAVAERQQRADGSWGDYVNWVECVMFGKRAEALAPWLTKGSKVAVLGRLHTGTYEVDDQTRKKWEVRVDDIELMQFRRDGRQPAPADASSEGIPY